MDGSLSYLPLLMNDNSGMHASAPFHQRARMLDVSIY